MRDVNHLRSSETASSTTSSSGAGRWPSSLEIWSRAWLLPVLASLWTRDSGTPILGKARTISDLLTEIRMTIAANQLRISSMSTGAPVDTVGINPELRSSAPLRTIWMSRQRTGEGCKEPSPSIFWRLPRVHRCHEQLRWRGKSSVPRN